MDFGKMNNICPENSNGSPVLGYQIDLATVLYSLQKDLLLFLHAQVLFLVNINYLLVMSEQVLICRRASL
jgi:hypothetical protein